MGVLSSHATVRVAKIADRTIILSAINQDVGPL